MSSWISLADEEAESFEIVWNQEVFEEGKVGLEESTFTLIRDIRNSGRVYEKNWDLSGLRSVLSSLDGCFCLGDDSLYGVGFSTGFCTGLSLHFFSMYLIFILHELGHAFCGYLTGYRLVALGLGSFLLTKKAGKFRLSRTAVLKNVGAQYIGLKEDESDQRMILMLSGGILVHLTLLIVSILLEF